MQETFQLPTFQRNQTGNKRWKYRLLYSWEILLTLKIEKSNRKNTNKRILPILMTWSKEILKKLEKEGRIKTVHIPKEPKNKVKIPKSIGKYKLHLISVLEDSGLKFIPEFKFHPVREFRFDWALPDLMVAVEFEGIISEKSRHTSIAGFSKDCEKYNLAQCLGWKVLRYTILNYKNFENDLKEIQNQ